MIEIAKIGRLRTQMPDAQARRAATQVRQNAAARAWAASSPVSAITEADYVKKIRQFQILLLHLRWEYLCLTL
jgi:hypothetical protein